MTVCHEIFKVKGNSEIIASSFHTSGKETKVLKLVAELGLEIPPLYFLLCNSEIDETDSSALGLKSLPGSNVITLFKLSSPPRSHASFILMSFRKPFLSIFQSSSPRINGSRYLYFGPFWAGQPRESL